MSAAIPQTREQILQWHARRARAEASRRTRNPLAGRLVADSSGTLHIAPIVHCDRRLPSAWWPR